ncbi:MAG: patatin-like phospholipase family protein [Rhizobiaceae bacterium]
MKEVALALGGGGARGIAHIQVLEALDDLQIRPVEIAGSSIGAIMGAGYAAGMSGAEMREYVIETFTNNAQVMSRLWRLRPDTLRDMFSQVPRIGELNAQKVLRAFLPHRIPETFEELEIPLKVTATDYYGCTLTVIEEGGLWPAIAASSAIPAVFRPEMINGRVHVDGGISNPVAFDLLEKRDRIVVAVDVVAAPKGEATRIPSRLEAAFGASQLMMQALTSFKLKLHQPDLLVRPAVEQFKVLDFLHAKEILEATSPTRSEVRTKLERILSSS